MGHQPLFCCACRILGNRAKVNQSKQMSGLFSNHTFHLVFWEQLSCVVWVSTAAARYRYYWTFANWKDQRFNMRGRARAILLYNNNVVCGGKSPITSEQPTLLLQQCRPTRSLWVKSKQSPDLWSKAKTSKKVVDKIDSDPLLDMCLNSSAMRHY